MKTSQLLAAVLMTSGGLASFNSMASAGEGGAAGAVSVLMDANTSKITHLSAASAVGKLNAAATTNTTTANGSYYYGYNNTSPGTFASAYGSAGAITVSNAGTTNVNLSGVADTQLGAAQVNTLAAPATISATTSTVVIP